MKKEVQLTDVGISDVGPDLVERRSQRKGWGEIGNILA